MSDFGSRLKLTRKSRKITQKRLANLLGVAQSTIANYETNERFPGESTLKVLSDTLEVSIDYLLGTNEANQNFRLASPLYDNSDKEDESASKLLEFDFLEDLLHGDEETAISKVMQLNQFQLSIGDVIVMILEPTLKEVGRRWANGQLEVAQEHYISDVIERLLGLLSRSNLSETLKPFSILFTVPGAEEHTLTLKLAAEFFRQAGWRVFYVGRSLPFKSLSWMIKQHAIDVVALSVTLPTHLNSAEHLLCSIKSLPSDIMPKILVGGAAVPDVNTALNMLGADYYSPSLDSLNSLIDYMEKDIKVLKNVVE
jgi:transcriptional regulator with XRE-family HTH domain/methylmalonyl-CoA mutase cobalamin-binding subunit